MKKRILVADDNIKFRRSAKAILQKAGYSVSVASDGEEVLDVLKKKKHDVALLDIIMPVLTGLEACRKIKKKRKTKNTIVIMLSGNVTEIEIGFDYGADDCFLKPVNWETVFKKIKNLTGESD
ncbi:MAG: response regulator [Elusimicrobiota bacterium]